MTHITNHMPTAQLQALDGAHHMHPFTNNDDLAQKGARVIARADGVTLTDCDGVEIMDAMAGLWCVNIGYGRHELAEVAARQMRELPYYNTFFKTTHVPAISLAQKIAQLAPGDLNHVFFSLGGSDANDTNLRLVRQYWAAQDQPDKRVVISRKNAYHGSTMAGASLGGMNPMHAQGGLPIGDICHIEQPYWWGEGGDLSPEEFGLLRARALEDKINELGAENVAAFIGEPIQGAGGVIIPPSTYWPEIQRICKDYDILLIADEVITGFGRTANWWGSDTFNIKADLITIAKGLSSGYAPIGASVISDKLASVINADEFNHGYTYSGHPVSCAVALENIRILQEEQIVENAREKTAPYLAQKWAQFADHPLVGEARICGMIGALALTPDKAARAAFQADTGTVGLIGRDSALANNLVMRHVGDNLVISPPLIITRAQIDTMIDRAARTLDQTLDQLKTQGLMVSRGQ